MYTPSVETQRALPEIPLQSNDDLKVIGSQTVVQIFEHNPLVITIEKTKSLHYDYTIKPGTYPIHNKGPIGVNIGNIKEKAMVTERKRTLGRRREKIVQTNTADLGYDISDETKYNGYGYKTFDTWFYEQARVFPELTKTGYSDIINIYVFKNEVVKIIKLNGMTIGVDGLVHDLTGSIVDMRNLKLRRIVIEERTVNQGIDSPFVSLDGVMVTVVYPPKILGVIPMKSTYFPDELPQTSQSLQATNLYQSQQPLHQTIQTTHSVKSSMPIEHAVVLNEMSQKCKGSLCNKQSSLYGQLPAGGILKEKSKSTTVVSTSSHNINDIDDIEKQLRLQFGKKFDTEIQMRKETKKPEDDSSLKYLTNVLNAYKLTPLNQLTKLMKTFVGPISAIMNQGTETKEDSKGEEAQEKTGDDYLGFRIIGGNAATASGAPLNLRGRSAHTDII
ncbi:uncharacterized protein ACR2FA_012804 [Aphomia sociella]